MTGEDIIRMARQAGLWVPGFPTEHIERYAELVAAAERDEWLEKLTRADWRSSSIFRHYYPSANGDWVNLRELTEVIRARCALEAPPLNPAVKQSPQP